MDSIWRARELESSGLLSSAVTTHAGSAVSACFMLLILWAASYMLYNILLHPLRNYPGPKLWAVTRLPWTWFQSHGTINDKLLELHLKYGSVVRIAPNALSYTTDTAWKTIYGHRSVEMHKDPIFTIHTPTGVQNILTADRQTHTRQRRLLSHAFSEKALREQEGILQSYVDKLVEQLSSRCGSGQLDIGAWLNFAMFDVIGDLFFGEKFGCLDKGDYVPFNGAVKSISKELTYFQMLRFYGLAGLRKYLMPKDVAGARMENMKSATATVDRRIDRETDRKDFLYYILSAKEEKGMSREEIHVNAFSLSTAGSESSATCLAGAVFYSLMYPETYQKLVSEVRNAYTSESEISMASVNDLEYLDAVLTESLRLYPPVAGTLPRIVPAGGETIDEAYVPAGTSVGVNHFSCFRHPKNFYRPNDFMPERWVAETREAAPFDQDNRACMQPFSYGPRNCLGKNLARAEMRLTLAKLLWRFDFELAEGSENWQKEQKVFGFWHKGPLMCSLTPVKRD